MATAYWTGGQNVVLSANPLNWSSSPTDNIPHTPQDGDDLVFDVTLPIYEEPCNEYDGTMDGMTFGTITANDGSNVLDGTMQAGAVYLTAYSTIGYDDAGGTCSTLNAGADGSACTSYSTVTGDAIFAGTSINNGDIGPYSIFNNQSTNNGYAGDSTTYNDFTTDISGDGTNVTFNDYAVSQGAYLGDGVTFNNYSSINGLVVSGSAYWNSSGNLSDAENSILIEGTLYMSQSPSLFTVENESAFNVVITAADVSIPVNVEGGSWTGTVSLDTTNLAAGNIKSGETILGVEGTLAIAAGRYLNGGSAGY